MKENSTTAEIRKGLLVLAVLRVIGARRVYAAELLAILNETEFATQEGTLYPMLSRLRRDGLIDYEWVESASGPPRKYYRLNEAGEAHEKSLMQYIEQLESQLNKLGEKS